MSSLVHPRSQPSQQVASGECLQCAPPPRRQSYPETCSYATAPSRDLLSTPVAVSSSPRSGLAEKCSSIVALKLSHVAHVDPFGSTYDIPAMPTVSQRKHADLLLSTSGPSIASPSLSVQGPPAIRTVSRNPSSMSLRRLASNRPALQCKVDMPPAPVFPSSLHIPTTPGLLTPGKAISPLPLSLRQFSLAYSQTRTSSASPVTPIDQIMPKTPLSPPPLEAHITSPSKSKLRGAILAVRLQNESRTCHTLGFIGHSTILGLGLELYDAQRNSPVSPLGIPSPFRLDAPLSAKPSPLGTSRVLFSSLPPATSAANICSALERGVKPAPKGSKNPQSSAGSCPGSQALLRPRVRPPLRLSLPRRLSYNCTGFTCSPGGTPTLRSADHELASPAVIGLQVDSGAATLSKCSEPVENPGTPAASSVHGHQPRMVELGSYF